ncbi:PDZ domain-containing protein, partial [Planctomycetota bacterium]
SEERRRAMERAHQAMIDRVQAMNERERTRKKSIHEKNHTTILRAFRPVVAKANGSIATVLCDGGAAALGTVVDANGLILTKASELRGTLECKLPGGKKHKAQVVGISSPHDLALLKVAAKGLQPIAWSEAPAQVGALIATPGGKADPIAIGVISVAPRPMKERGLLGIMFPRTGDDPRVGQVMPGTAAAKAGLKPGDVITKVDGKAVETRDDVIKTIGAHPPGDKIDVHFQRGGEEKKVTVTLGSRRLSPQRQRRLDMMNMFGGPLSDRRTGFESALQHDTILLPSQCGGPLVDLDGKVVGINVARAGRVESYAIPADVARPLLDDLKSGKLSPGPDFGVTLKLKAIDRRIAAHERVLRKAERDKADAERRIKLAKGAINKDKAEKGKLEEKKKDAAPPKEAPKKPEPKAEM